MNTTTDFHQTGVFAVKDPDGNVLFDTFASTAYSARATFGRLYNKKWHAAEQQGYTMHGYGETVKVVSEPREGDSAATDATSADLDIPRTADEWDIYSDKPGAEQAAAALGDKLEELLRAALQANNRTHEEAVRIRDLMYAEMEKYEGIGATDTEPETILCSRIESALGLKYDSLPR